MYIESYLYIESGTVHIELYQDRFRFSPVYKLTSLYIFLINENEVYLLIWYQSNRISFPNKLFRDSISPASHRRFTGVSSALHRRFLRHRTLIFPFLATLTVLPCNFSSRSSQSAAIDINGKAELQVTLSSFFSRSSWI